MPSPSLLQRLKERKLVQWGLAYLAGAWVIYEATGTALEAWDIPVAYVRALHVLLAVGFFVTLILAWYHGEKGRQRVSGPELLMVIGVLVVAGVAMSTLKVPERTSMAPVDDVDDERPSIAVLQCDNFSPNPEDAFRAQGIHEEILLRLQGISSLRSIGRTSVLQFAENPPPVNEVAATLRVEYVGECSVLKDPDETQIRITFQLMDASGTQVWADSYDRDLTVANIYQIQGDIAQSVANSVGAALEPAEEDRIATTPTQNLLAYDLYTQGRILWNQRTEPETREAIRLFREAITLDPDYAEAHVGLADAFLILGQWEWEAPDDSYPVAQAAAERAVGLNQSLAGAHAALGGVDTWYNRDWSGAEVHFQKALALNPNHAYARYWYSILLDAMARHDDARAQVLRARELDPLSPQINRGVPGHYYAARDFEGGLAEALEFRQTFPQFVYIWWDLCDAYIALHRFDEARTACQTASAETDRLYYGTVLIHALQGDREAALRELDRLRAEEGADELDPMRRATILIALGNVDGAFSLLYRARDDRYPYVYWLTYELLFDPIRSDSRFKSLMEELRLPIIEY
jgi:TolB-like protein